MLDEAANLKERLSKLEAAFQVEQRTTQEQIAELKSAIQQEQQINHQQAAQFKKRRGQADVFLLAGIAFFALLVLSLISLRIEYQGISFGVPVEALIKALEAPAIAGAVTLGVTVLMKRFQVQEK